MKLKLHIFGSIITHVFINICTTMENKRGEAWTHEETVLLIELWGDQRVQEQLENTPKRNLEIFKWICQDIKDCLPDFSRSAQDCRAQIKRLKTKHFQTRTDNNKSRGKRKTFPYYDRLDGLLGTRPTVNPVALSDSLINSLYNNIFSNLSLWASNFLDWLVQIKTSLVQKFWLEDPKNERVLGIW